jgi:hypothetical protein
MNIVVAWLLGVLVAFGLGIVHPTVQAQEQPSAGQPAEQYYSGTITQLDRESVTVYRTVLGSNASSRSFRITDSTKIEGKLRAKARVTVRYITRDEGDEAVYILVRTARRK